MFTVYIIRSIRENWYYVGFTENLERRIDEHNKKQVRSTKSKSPFKLIFTKKFDSRIDARNFEKFLKIRSNKEKLLAEVAELADA